MTSTGTFEPDHLTRDLERRGVPAWAKTLDGRYLMVTESLARHVGAAPADMLGRLDAEFWSASEARDFRASDYAALASRSSVLVPEQHDGGVLVTTKGPLVRAGRVVGTIGWFEGAAPSTVHREARGLAPMPGAWFGWIESVRTHLVSHFRESLSLRELAGRHGVHPSHLGRAFRRASGVTVRAFVRRLRIDWACVQLLATPWDVGRIALEAGFADQSHFARAFRREMGTTATRYRDGASAVAPRTLRC